MNNFSHQSKRLQSAGAKLFQQQKFRKVMKVSLIRNREHSAEAFQIDIPSANFMMCRHP